MTLKTTEVIVNIENDLTINAEIGTPIEIKPQIYSGARGARGAIGKSAYEVWVEAGNEGSVDDFLQWLRVSNSYTHIEQASGYTWAINHNLGKYPSVFVVDTGGNWVIGDVQYLNENQIIVRFTYEFSGIAYLN